MSNPNEIRDRLLDETGGESLEGSDFESETVDLTYSDDHPTRLDSITDKEPNDVH